MKKEGEIMARVMNKISDVKIPPYIRKEIGVSDDWIEKVSPKQKKLAVRIANKFKEALRKLSKS